MNLNQGNKEQYFICEFVYEAPYIKVIWYMNIYMRKMLAEWFAKGSTIKKQIWLT